MLRSRGKTFFHFLDYFEIKAYIILIDVLNLIIMLIIFHKLIFIALTINVFEKEKFQ